MNIYDISLKAGVSIATVSRVLNGSDKVKSSTRKKVMDVIEESGYTPNAFARSLGLNSMSTIGILCSDASDVYQAQAIYYLERELRKSSYTSMLCCTGYQIEERKKHLQLLISKNVDAVFFIGSHFVGESDEENAYIRSAAEKFPVFILNGELSGQNIYSVLCNDFKAGKEITDLVFEKGSKLPIYLYRALNYSGQRKMQGFLDSCSAHGLDMTQKRTFSCPGPTEKTREILERIEDIIGMDFDAVVAADDELAVGAVKYAVARNKKIPEEFQITGYNNSVLSTCSTPELTTMDNRVEFLCVTAVEQMMQVLEKKDVAEHTMFSGRIIERETTKR